MSAGPRFELEDLDRDESYAPPSFPRPPAESLGARTNPMEPPAERQAHATVAWLLSPTFYYAIATATALACLLVWFNPTFGIAMESWPWAAVAYVGQPDLSAPAAVTLVALGLASVGGLLGFLFGDRAARPAWMTTVFLLPFLAGQQPQALLLLPAAFLAGILLSGAPPRARRGHLFTALVVLGGLLFFPTTQTPGDSYASVGTAALEHARSFSDMPGSALAAAASLLPAFLSLALLTIGGLAWMGLGGGYIRWVTATVVLLAYALGCVAGWDAGSELPGLALWQAHAVGWASALYGSSLALLLPLMAAVCEWQRRAIPGA